MNLVYKLVKNRNILFYVTILDTIYVLKTISRKEIHFLTIKYKVVFYKTITKLCKEKYMFHLRF